MLYYFFLILIFLAFSAFFSGMEAAIFSLSRFRVRALVFEGRRGALTLERLKGESGRTLASILLANLLVNVGAASIGALILMHIITVYNLNTTVLFIIEFVIMTSFLLLVGEITPKTIGLAHAEGLALRFGIVIAYLSRVLYPISTVLAIISRRTLLYQRRDDTISDQEIRLMLSEARRYKVLDEREERFGYQILKFGRIKAREIMTPRQKVVGVDCDADIERARQVIIASKHSRICVFDQKGDILGILYAKDLFIRQINASQDAVITIRSLTREPYVIPETKHIDSLLAEFRKQAVHIGVVVDEFGSFTGILTLEDILESLFGEIIDEYDELADLPYIMISPDTFVFVGDISIGELAHILGVEPFAPEEERLSGFLMSYYGRIPREKEQLTIANLEITIEEMRNRIIERVLIKKRADLDKS